MVLRNIRQSWTLKTFAGGYLVLDLVYSEVEFVLGEDRGLAQKGL